MTHKHARGAGGFSLVETTIILSVLTLLASVMAPSIGDYVVEARLIKARADMQMIAVAVSRFAFDVTLQSNQPDSWSHFDVLVGEGEIPGSTANETVTWVAKPSSGRASSLDAHLVTNEAGHARRESQFGGGMFSRGWAGPYLSGGIGPDPWGYRYAVSVRHMADGSGSSALVISAGPDGIIETPFNGNGVSTNSDDLTVLLAPGR